MKTKEQVVALYPDINMAHDDMERSINIGWRVCSCVSDGRKILVVYEKDLETYN